LKITYDAMKAIATPAMVTVCATQRGITRQNRPAMMAPTSGARGTSR
jgi:hypothetical protein